ncbi:Transcription factor, MADS-box [Dillenia turbinata]|uniref:Transcription factor, MADS-box n=1 Tax=Dillenia turbinata TaxID=194707 RepID=A0AAN8YYP3_9MAGN
MEKDLCCLEQFPFRSYHLCCGYGSGGKSTNVAWAISDFLYCASKQDQLDFTLRFCLLMLLCFISPIEMNHILNLTLDGLMGWLERIPPITTLLSFCNELDEANNFMTYIAFLVCILSMDLSKSKKRKLPGNSKAHYLAMERRKENLFKKASELSTLCGIEVCIIVYDDQKPNTAAETWPKNHNDVLRMVKRCKGRMSKNQGKKTLRTEETLPPAAVEPTSTHSESKLLDTMVMTSQDHFGGNSQRQSCCVSDNIVDVCTQEFWNNLRNCCTDFVVEDEDVFNNLNWT